MKIGKSSLVIKMNISKHFSKRFGLNFTLNQSPQNPERTTVHNISEIHCYVVKSNNLSTIFAVLYKSIMKIKIIVLSWKHGRKRESAFSVDQFLILHVCQ